MNFQAIASTYESSGSETDEDPSSGVVSTLDSPGKEKRKGEVQADNSQGKRFLIGNSKERLPELQRARPPPTSAPRLPPPPIALLGLNETPNEPPSRERKGPPHPIAKRRKIENQSERLPADILLPRQVQTRTPNVPTEDLQSYGIASKAEREP